MFPSTGHFKSLHCPFYLEDDCKRIYCHFRHVKNVTEKSGENNQLLALKDQICKSLRIDDDTFYSVMNESNETIQEKNLNKLLKKVFPDQSSLIDDFRLPETASKDAFEFLQSSDSTDDNVGDLINLTEQDDDTPLDEGPLKQFLAEDAKRNSDSEQSNRNTLEKRHIIISCLEKIDKKEFKPRRSVQPKKLSTLVGDVPAHETAPVDMNEILTQPVIHDSIRIKQEDDGSDSSGSEDNAEVDSILSQMELLNPQLFGSDESRPIKCEPTDRGYGKENELQFNLASQETIAASQMPTQVLSTSTNSAPTSSTSSFCQPTPPAKPRINPKSVQAINSEVTSSVSVIPRDVKSEQHERMLTNSVILTAASIAEQNRLKNVFKNTICANIDQFFDLCDACKVYGTEIFNLLEPLLNYLIEKLNPEFNFEKLRQLHSQNVSLACSLPLVGACDHVKDCIECHNLMQCAMTKCNAKKEEKSVQTTALNTNSSLTDTPLRKIEAGLFDITKEIISLGIPMVDSKPSSTERNAIPRPETKHAQCQTDASSHSSSHSGSHSSRSSSHSSHRHADSKKHSSSESSRHRSKESKSSSDSRKRHEESKRSSSDKHSKHSRSDHRSSKSSTENHKKKHSEKSQSADDSSDEECEKHSKRRRSSSTQEPKVKKRSSVDKDHSVEPKKIKIENSAPSKSVSEKKKPLPDEIVTVDSSPEASEDSDDSDGLDNIPGLTVSDVDSDREDFSKNTAPCSDSEDEDKNDSDIFVDPIPSTAAKKRVSHVTEGTSYLVQRKHIPKKNLPSPAEVLFQRMQQTKKAAEASAAEAASNQLANDRIRISHVPNVALLLKAKERIKNNLLKPAKLPAAPPKTAAQTVSKGSSRLAHVPSEPPKPKDVPTLASSCRPVIDSYKNNNNIPLPTRQTALDRLYNVFAKKVPPDLASELALKEERNIHEKVTITKIYLNSLAMAIHRITKADPASLIQKNTEYPSEINGFATYDLLSKHLLTYEQLEVNGFPLGITARPGCCRISTKAIHYKPLMNKRSGDRFYCLQCKDLFELDPETGIPITPSSGCKFHQLRPRKEPGRLRHELFYPCCNKSISESGCVTAEHHTLDTTDDDCIEGFVETREAPPGESSKTFYSLDCEMCFTTVGSELTRVTIIGPDCSTVYDKLVKPRNKILDYCTKFSGITKEKLRNVTRTLEDVRQELFKFIFKDTILIGHSLENDLKALKILHYNIVDTSVMYPHRDAPERKFALKFISSREVQFLIQESEFGHDSQEDALACMKLVWKKIREDAQSYRPRKIIGSPERNK